MATVGTTTFQTIKVVEAAFRRCRVAPATISSEMLQNATDALYLWLSELANGKAPAWCIEKQIYPLYAANPVTTLTPGTVDVLNVNLRVLQPLTGAVITSSTEYREDAAGTVSTVGIKWTGASVDVSVQVSSDLSTWTEVATSTATASAGEWTWIDIPAPVVGESIKIVSTSTLQIDEVFLGTLPQEIPLGALNRDTYSAQTNKTFQGRPLTYYFQRLHPQPVLNLWPAPNADAEHQQLIVWRHRHIMDLGALSSEVEMPQRWLEAMIAGLAARLAIETPTVEPVIVQMLDAKAIQALQVARDGDNDGSPIFLQPNIRIYNR